MSAWYKVMCVCECCISAKSMHSSLLPWRDFHLRNLNDLNQNSQNRRYDEMDNLIFYTYKKYVMPHGFHIYATVAEMYMKIMCAYPPYQHALSHWKCVLVCCSNLPHIDILDQYSDRRNSNASPSINFHFYHLIARCTVRERQPLDEKKICSLCLQDLDNVTHAKIYTRKELVMMETYISDFHKSFYIP